ncbi:MAG TPA: polynucleotide adenylyltransferase PcnB [Gammaproteobacteria bacterium]
MFSWIKTPWWKRTEATQGVAADGPLPPRIIPRADHTISRALISESALKVLYRLQKEGYEAYLVGGGVRDLLLGREPKDFDVATSARPEEMKRLFRNCRLIGRRFLLAHVQFGREIIEVATFRAQHDGDDDVSESGMLLRDNVYGTLEDDAWRRDFTINALYYNVGDFSVVDHTGGMEDLKAGVLRVIGDPVQRFREDPVRMLRAVRFAAKLGFQIDEESEAALYELGHLLEDVAPARLFDESLKLFLGGYGVQTYELLRHYRLFGYLFPETEIALAQEENHFPHTMLLHALENTDARIAEDKPVTPAFLFAALLWEPLRREAALFKANNMPEIQALQLAGDAVVSRQVQRLAVPKRFTLQSREIWTLQERLLRRNGKRAWAMVENPRFRAAYDFLLLRAQSGEEVAELAQWWSEFQGADEEGRKRLVEGLGREGGAKPKGKRRRPPRRRPNPSAPTT